MGAASGLAYEARGRDDLRCRWSRQRCCSPGHNKLTEVVDKYSGALDEGEDGVLLEFCAVGESTTLFGSSKLSRPSVTWACRASAEIRLPLASLGPGDG
jgi:hypothetical protein